MLSAGLSRIPSYPHSFLLYLWTSLVEPAMCYGMDLFCFSETYLQSFRTRECKWWRRLLQVGGRSPNNAVQVLFGNAGCDIFWRTSRASLVLKLLNSPAGSWQHLAAIAHNHLQTPWFAAALVDLRLVLPSVRLAPTTVASDPFLSSSGSWSEEGEWMCFHAYRLPICWG